MQFNAEPYETVKYWIEQFEIICKLFNLIEITKIYICKNVVRHLANVVRKRCTALNQTSILGKN